MKKLLAYAFIGAFIIVFGGGTLMMIFNEEFRNDVLTKETPAEEVEEPTEEIELTIEETIQIEVDRIVNEDFRKVEINDLNINLHAGRDDGSYIVLPHLKWDVKNRASTTRDMLEQYSDHLAATLADIDEVSEITVFWEVPYHKEDTNIAKHEYAREGEGMAIGDIWHDVVIRD